MQTKQDSTKSNLNKNYMSDHHPFLAKGSNISCIAWNILYLMKFNTKYGYFNNGFAKEESPDEYKARLKHIAEQIRNALLETGTEFIFLQECPKEKTDQEDFIHSLSLINKLDKYSNVKCSDNTSKMHLITLYDKDKFNFNEELTKKLKSSLIFTEGLKDCTDLFVFEDKKTKKTILTVNVHADFPQEVKQDLAALMKLKDELKIDEVLLAGDFNRDLVSTHSEINSKIDIASSLDKNKMLGKLYVDALPDTSFIYLNRKNIQTFFITTCDGVISSFPMKLRTMEYINQPISNQSVTLDTTKLDTKIQKHSLEWLGRLEKEFSKCYLWGGWC